MDHALQVEDEDPFHFLLEDRNDSPLNEETLAAALTRFNHAKFDARLQAREDAQADMYGNRCNDLRYDPLDAFDDLQPPSSSGPNPHPSAFDCNSHCSFDFACSLPDCNLDPRPLQTVCCEHTCQESLTVTCNDRDCSAPNRCDQVCGTCNNTSCQTEPCADPECPVSFSHFDLCFEAACAPTPSSAECSPAPCDLGNCNGTFVTNTCSDAAHQGWDPNCPNSLFSSGDLVHDYQSMPPPSSGYGYGLLQNSAYGLQNGHHTAASNTCSLQQTQLDSFGYSQYGVESYSGSQNQSTSSSSPTPSSSTLYDQSHWLGPGGTSPIFSSRKRSLNCSQPRKRQRFSNTSEPENMQGLISAHADQADRVDKSTHAHQMSHTKSSTHSVCQWVMNPKDTFGPHRLCLYHAASPKDLHDHLVNIHTSQLTSHTRFHCQWGECPRFLTADYGQKSKLNRHLLTHSAFLPYPCAHPGCSKAFSTNDQRRNHEATHTDERKYVCDWPDCGAKFRHATSLTTHKYTHTGEKPYVCWICGHREGDPSNKSKHMKKEHPSLPRQRPTDWDADRTRTELEAHGYTWPPNGCALDDGCSK